MTTQEQVKAHKPWCNGPRMSAEMAESLGVEVCLCRAVAKAREAKGSDADPTLPDGEDKDFTADEKLEQAVKAALKYQMELLALRSQFALLEQRNSALKAQLRKIERQWLDQTFWSETGNYMDSMDCARVLSALLADPPPETQEPDDTRVERRG